MNGLYIYIRNIYIKKGSVVYALGGIGVVLPVETSMKNKERYPRIMIIVMTFSTLNYVMFGLVPYLAFGDDTSDVVQKNNK